ncbi:hypothetical protein [Enterocloster bolteae]|uniref:hypothetical protein n=1 Tax=Enterocloster bolteae TaxID=208479 RepID=UPI00210B41C8|nr:hypothetical protein [Enterocloster bolteae]MCQ5140950.1 hypothetical protein [Enterocloster bolteae]
MSENRGKELIEDCIQLLNIEQRLDSGGNRARYPVILVFFGEGILEFVPAVRKTLEDNWNNAKFLKYLQVVRQREGIVCRDLVSGEESGDTEAFLEKAVVDMLATEEYIFEDKNRVKFEFILQGDDLQARDYYELMLGMNRSHSYSVMKTLYLMMDESEKEKKGRTRDLLSYITETREDTRKELGAVYLLSNYLKNGSILLGQRLMQNYRLVADIILLGGNRGSDGHAASLHSVYQSDSIKTAAYALVEKPIRNITIISLRRLLEGLLEMGMENSRQMEGREFKCAEDLKKKLGIQPGSIDCIEALFDKEIKGILPRPEELAYLPYLSERNCKEAYREKNISWNVLDSYTGGNWSLFFREYYMKPMEKKLENENFLNDCRQKMEDEWRQKISYFDAIYGLENGRVGEAVSGLKVVPPIRDSKSMEENLHYRAVGEVKKGFYARMTQLLKKTEEAIRQDAQRLRDQYKELLNEVIREDIDDREQKRNIKNFYEAVTDTFLKREGERALEGVFSLKSEKGQMMAAIRELFVRLLKENAVYGYSFEQELSERLHDASDEDRMMMVTNELEQNIEGYGRLHWSNFTYSNQLRGTYYLINNKAEYARELDDNSSEYSIFHLNRTDCIEKIAIYDLDDRDNRCDLTEMAGDA